MASALKRSIAFLLVLVLAIGMIPTAFAAEVLFQRKSAVGNCDRWFYRKRQVHK